MKKIILSVLLFASIATFGQLRKDQLNGINTRDIKSTGSYSSFKTGKLNDSTYLSLLGVKNNLSDLNSVSTARTNLGLGSLATLTPGTGVATALAINVGNAGAFITFNGAAGTFASGIATNLTGLPISTGLTGGGTNRVPYFTSATVMTTTSTFLFDGTNLGIGATPQSLLTVSKQTTIQAPVSGSTVQYVGLDANPLRITYDTHNNSNASGTALMLRRSKGTAASPSADASGDDLGSFNVRGYGTTGYAAASTGLLSFKANQTFTDTNMGTYASIYTTPDNSVTAAEAFRIGGAGQLGIGGSTYGNANALFTSGGSVAAPTWTSTGTGVLTWLTTPSWTNFNAAITGTAPFWSSATGATLTGANTITTTVANTLTFSSSGTTTANNQIGKTIGSTFTMRGTAADNFTDNYINPVITIGSTTQNPLGLNIDANFVQSGTIPISGVNYSSIQGSLSGMTATTYTNVAPASTSGSGTGALFNITATATTLTFTSVANAGTGYKTNETITFNGSQFGSGSGSASQTIKDITGLSVGTGAAPLRIGITGVNFMNTAKFIDFYYQGALTYSLVSNSNANVQGLTFLNNAGSQIMTLGAGTTSYIWNNFQIGSALAVVGATTLNSTLDVVAGYTRIRGNQSISTWTTNGEALQIAAATITDTGGSGTRATGVESSIGIHTYTNSGAANITITDAAGLYIAGAPTSSNTSTGSMTLTRTHALWVAGGLSRFDGGIKGSITNDAAAAGNIGESISSLIASGSAVSLTTATTANITSISLTAGDWDVEGIVNFTETTSTVTARSAGTTSTSATVPSDGSEGYCGVQSTVTSEINSIPLQSKRFSLSGTTTVYLVARATFSAGTCAGFGSIYARRVR